jgi:hypothetical protein
VPTYRTNYGFDLEANLAGQDKESEMKMTVLRQREVFDVVCDYGWQVLQVVEDDSADLAPSALSGTFVVQKA